MARFTAALFLVTLAGCPAGPTSPRPSAQPPPTETKASKPLLAERSGVGEDELTPGRTPSTPSSAGFEAGPDVRATGPRAAAEAGPPVAWELRQRDFRPPNIPDLLRFHGWSKDGRRFAFEVWREGQGTRCSARAWLRVVDAAEDRFLARIDVTHPQTEGDHCRRSELEAQLAFERPRLLAEHGIALAPSPPRSPKRTRDGLYVVAGPRGPLRFELEERFTTDDIYSPEAEKGAAFRLTLHTDEGSRVVEAGTRRRRGVVGYRLDPSYLFVGPDGTHATLLLVRMDRAFEGAQWSWMASAFPMPALHPQGPVPLGAR